MASSRSVFSVDLYLALATVTLVVVGILFVFSSGVTATGQIVSREYLRQIAWASTGMVLMIGLALVDYRVLVRPTLLVYVGVISLLIFTLMFGRVVNGARSWIGIGPFGGQPSEFAKIGLVMMLARYFSVAEGRAKTLSGLAGGFALALLPTGLVLLQPDLGSSLVYIPIFLVVAFAAGAPGRYLAYLTGVLAMTAFIIVAPVWAESLGGGQSTLAMIVSERQPTLLLVSGLGLSAGLSLIGFLATRRRLFWWITYVLSIMIISIPLGWVARSVLQDYQIMRLVVFLDPYVDPRGAGWNIIQSTTAVGSGGLFGKGFLQGTQSHFQFLPQQSTDFIFSILAEEWGFVGVMVVFGLFATIIGRGLYIMSSSRDRFAALMVAGVVGMFLFHFLVNIGMAVGIMPVTGIPLYLLSYGGSSLWTALLSIGLVMSVYQHRYQY